MGSAQVATIVCITFLFTFFEHQQLTLLEMAGRLRDERPKKANDDFEDDSLLIPENVIDQASQRLFLVSIFVLIQCWKIYDILLIKADSFSAHMALDSGSTAHELFTSLNNFTFVLKYAIIDGFFLWMLPVLNVPLLRFLPLVTLLLTIVATAFTFMLASDSAIPILSGAFVPLWNLVFRNKELTIVGDSVNPQAVSDMNAHFKGSYTIRYLPELSVHLNPFHYDQLCLEASSNAYSTFPASIDLPIEFNTTTDLGFMQIQHTSPSKEVSYLEYSARDVNKLLRRDYSHLSSYPGYISKDERVFYLEINIKKPGTYKISRVTDKEGAVIRSYKSEFSVAHCPTSKFVYPGLDRTYSQTNCIGENPGDIEWPLPLVESYGVLPLQIQMAAEINGRHISTFNATVTESTADEEKTITNAVKLTRNALEQEVLKHPQSFIKGAPGSVKFHLLGVTDYLGNSRKYNPSSSDKDVLYSLNLNRSPKVHLIDRFPTKPLLVNSTKRIYFQAENDVSYPLTLLVQHQSHGDGGTIVNKTHTFTDAADFRKGIEILDSGSYRLIDGFDKACPCDVVAEPLIVTTPDPPKVQIAGNPITDKCVGDIGLEFDVKFSGMAPFKLMYQVFKNETGRLKPVLNDRGLATHTKTTSDENLKFQYQPKREGSYVVVFKELKDAYYQLPAIPIDEKSNTFTIYSRQRSALSLLADSVSKEIHLCKGENAQIPLSFSGNPPFSFGYQITDKATKKVVTQDKISSLGAETFEIVTPNFEKGGEFEVDLLDVRDSLDCPVEILGQGTVTIKARQYVPEVQITRDESFKIVEGDSVQIPFSYRHISSSPAKKLELAVQNLYDADDIKNISITARDTITVKEEGIYRINSFKDEKCPGVVKNAKSSVKVTYYPKPNLTFTTDEDNLLKQHFDGEHSLHLKLVCQNGNLAIKPQIEGSGPFEAKHRIEYPDGKVLSGIVPMLKEIINLPTDQKGNYEHAFTEVYDRLYTERVLSRLDYHQTPSTIRYSVLPNPSLKIGKELLHIQICESKVKNVDQISITLPVEFKGTAPFSVSGSIRHTNTDKFEKFEINDIVDNYVDLGKVKFSGAELADILTIGDHLVIFDSVSDGNTCKNVNIRSQNSVAISVTKVPEIRKESLRPYYCVGDHVLYKLHGISPFVVYYSFNDQSRKAEVGHDFQRLAAKPGELSIVALQDASVSRCLVNYTKIPEKYEELKLQIYALPSVEISHGGIIIEKLHEGDQAEISFKFTGVPPFEVTYVRTVGDDVGAHKRRSGPKKPGKRRKVVDSKTIKDIWDYEHTEIVSLEGTYDAIRVKDAYCQAVRDVEELL